MARWSIRLNPSYGADPVITLDGPPAAILAPTVRQRRRLGAALTEFGDAEWSHPTRCEGWTPREVILHLESTNAFWALSIAAGLRGEPTQFLASFDPAVTPAEIVAGSAEVSASEAYDRFVDSTEALEGLLTALGDDDWSMLAEAPPGHITISALTHHALWDSWVHEHDILLPLGVTPDVLADEVGASLRYVAALGPALAVTRGTLDQGTLTVDVTDPDIAFVVDVGDRVAVRADTADTAGADLRLTGDAVALLEVLSIRQPLDQPIPPGSAWMLQGLSETFDALT